MSIGIPFDPYYEPTTTRGHFTKEIEYSQVLSEKNDLTKMVDYFEERITTWYLEPVEVLLDRITPNWWRPITRFIARREDGGHYSFSVAAITFLLIDTLSQFENGLPESESSAFVKFVKDHLPGYNVPIRPAIDGYRPHRNPANPPRHHSLGNIADVLYSGYRCGILHEAHAKLYCKILPGNESPEYHARGYTTYGAGALNSAPGGDCPVVIIYPAHLFNKVTEYFEQYLICLKDPDPRYDGLRDDFMKKFSHSFGVDITGAVLS